MVVGGRGYWQMIGSGESRPGLNGRTPSASKETSCAVRSGCRHHAEHEWSPADVVGGLIRCPATAPLTDAPVSADNLGHPAARPPRFRPPWPPRLPAIRQLGRPAVQQTLLPGHPGHPGPPPPPGHPAAQPPRPPRRPGHPAAQPSPPPGHPAARQQPSGRLTAGSLTAEVLTRHTRRPTSGLSMRFIAPPTTILRH